MHRSEINLPHANGRSARLHMQQKRVSVLLFRMASPQVELRRASEATHARLAILAASTDFEARIAALQQAEPALAQLIPPHRDGRSRR